MNTRAIYTFFGRETGQLRVCSCKITAVLQVHYIQNLYAPRADAPNFPLT